MDGITKILIVVLPFDHPTVLKDSFSFFFVSKSIFIQQNSTSQNMNQQWVTTLPSIHILAQAQSHCKTQHVQQAMGQGTCYLIVLILHSIHQMGNKECTVKLLAKQVDEAVHTDARHAVFNIQMFF